MCNEINLSYTQCLKGGLTPLGQYCRRAIAPVAPVVPQPLIPRFGDDKVDRDELGLPVHLVTSGWLLLWTIHPTRLVSSLGECLGISTFSCQELLVDNQCWSFSPFACDFGHLRAHGPWIFNF